MTNGEEKAYYLVVTFNLSGLKIMLVRVRKTSIDESAEVASFRSFTQPRADIFNSRRSQLPAIRLFHP